MQDKLIGIHSHTLTTCDLPYSIVRSHDQPGLCWDQLNPALDVYSWTKLDDWVAYYHDVLGKELVYTFFGCPAWASSNPQDNTSPYGPNLLGHTYPPANYGNIVKFIRVLMARYAGKIGYIEVWNEPVFPVPSTGLCFYKGTPAQLASMTRVIKTTLMQKWPTVKIISPPPPNITTTDNIETILTAPAKGYGVIAGQYGDGTTLKDWIDIVGIHTYAIDTAFKNNITGLQLAALKVRLEALGIDKLIWCTEVGIHDTAALTSAERVARVTMTLLSALLGGCEAVFHYSIDHSSMSLTADEYLSVYNNIMAVAGLDNVECLPGGIFKQTILNLWNNI